MHLFEAPHNMQFYLNQKSHTRTYHLSLKYLNTLLYETVKRKNDDQKTLITDDCYLILKITVTKRQIISKIYLTGRSRLRRDR